MQASAIKTDTFVPFRGGCPRGIMEKELDYELGLQSRYYVQFRTNTLEKGMNPLVLQAMGWIVPLLFFKKDWFGIK